MNHEKFHELGVKNWRVVNQNGKRSKRERERGRKKLEIDGKNWRENGGKVIEVTWTACSSEEPSFMRNISHTLTLWYVVQFPKKFKVGYLYPTIHTEKWIHIFISFSDMNIGFM